MIAAVVLAAGRATRFGECKLLVQVAGKFLLEQVLEPLRASKVGDIVVVLGADADEIRARITFERERVVINDDYAKGMSTSIHAGLRALPADVDAAMIVLGDQPFVKRETLDRLIDECGRVSESAVVPTHDGGRGNPVILKRELFPRMLKITGDTGFRAILGEVPVAYVPVDDRGVVVDVDTREDLARPR